MQWMTGYLIEIIGSVENIFVFHIIIKAFRVPRSGAQQALFSVVCCQIVYQFVLFLGLGRELQMMWLLPFLLGPWLIYCGYHAAHADDQEELTYANFTAFRVCKACFGDRLATSCNGGNFFALGRDGRLRVTLLLPAFICLICADFFLELDTTLVKIEEIGNDFSGFSSSAFAAFAVPEFYFLARDIFQRYPSLKLGIAFSLTLFGADMLVSNFLTAIPPLTSCLMVFVIFLGIIVWSKIMEFLYPGVGYVYHGKIDSVSDLEGLQDTEVARGMSSKSYGSAAYTEVARGLSSKSYGSAA
jgi:tellurite resistance protein TerC